MHRVNQVKAKTQVIQSNQSINFKLGGGGVMFAIPTRHRSHTTTPRWLGPLSINLEGRVPDAKLFFTWQIQTAAAHAHNTLLLYLVFYVVDWAQTFSATDIGPLAHSKHLQHPIFLAKMCMCSLDLLYIQFSNLKCAVPISKHVSYPLFQVRAQLPECFLRYSKCVVRMCNGSWHGCAGIRRACHLRTTSQFSCSGGGADGAGWLLKLLSTPVTLVTVLADASLAFLFFK